MLLDGSFGQERLVIRPTYVKEVLTADKALPIDERRDVPVRVRQSVRPVQVRKPGNIRNLPSTRPPRPPSMPKEPAESPRLPRPPSPRIPNTVWYEAE